MTPEHVLIADDYEGAAELLALVIEDELGCEATAVANGQPAVEAASRQRPDVCLLDIDMPVMGGVEAARRLRLAHPSPPPLLMVAITGGSGGTASNCAYFDAVFLKPVDLPALYALIRKA